jgi:hypothetical protein
MSSTNLLFQNYYFYIVCKYSIDIRYFKKMVDFSGAPVRGAIETLFSAFIQRATTYVANRIEKQKKTEETKQNQL